jgi:signal transduction histidine kinase
MKGFVETLAGRWDNLGDEQKRGVVERLLPQSRRLNRVVDRLLTAADIQAGAVVAPAMEPIELEPVLQKAADRFTALAPLHHFEVDAEPGMAAAADRKVLDRVLEQLVDNAVRFSPSGGAVRLAARRQGRKVEVTVEDEGIGFPPKASRMFDAFVQGEAVDDRVHAEGGVGVGLFIVRSLLAPMGAGVRAESRRPAPGSRLVATLRSAAITRADRDPLARVARVNSPK